MQAMHMLKHMHLLDGTSSRLCNDSRYIVMIRSMLNGVLR